MNKRQKLIHQICKRVSKGNRATYKIFKEIYTDAVSNLKLYEVINFNKLHKSYMENEGK